MTYAENKNRLICCILALVMVGCTLFGVVQPIISYAAEVTPMETSNVLDDLRSSTIDGKSFSLLDYPFDESKDVTLLSFVEYCYSYRANERDRYALYVYVYNPKGLNIATGAKQNQIQMAYAYDADGNPTNYAKYELQFVSKVESGDYKNLFYKFRVVDKSVNGKTIAERVNSNERRYDVSGIELTTYGQSTATEYPVCGTYKFRGFAAGLGPDTSAGSTLTSTVEYLESISLDVKHTYYRSKTSALGAGHQNQLDTVYFSVPKRYIDTYGKLQRIKAEWYEYKTGDIVVTSNADFYEAALPFIGKYMGDLNQYGMYPYVEDVGYKLALDAADYGDISAAKWGWNLGTGYLHPALQRLSYLFYTDDIDSYDPLGGNGDIASGDLYEYIMSYQPKEETGWLPVKNGAISGELLPGTIDADRLQKNEFGEIKRGYSYYDFDADVDLQVLKSWSSTSPSFWDNWTQYGLGAAFSGGPEEESRVVAPIQILTASDLKGTNAEVAERLMINANDVDALRTEYNNAVTVTGGNDEEAVVVLFRFATTDYYSTPIDIIEVDGGFLWTDKKISGEAYLARESVFLDFDIIQLTFNREGEYTVIPVVSNPIDIVDDVTPPVEMPPSDGEDIGSELRAALAIVGLLLILMLLIPAVTRLVKAFVLPVKGKRRRK